MDSPLPGVYSTSTGYDNHFKYNENSIPECPAEYDNNPRYQCKVESKLDDPATLIHSQLSSDNAPPPPVTGHPSTFPTPGSCRRSEIEYGFKVSRSQFIPPVHFTEWPVSEIDGIVNRFWRKCVPLKQFVPSDQLNFSRSQLQPVDIHAGILINVIRWLSRFLAEGIYPSLGQLSVRGIDRLFTLPSSDCASCFTSAAAADTATTTTGMPTAQQLKPPKPTATTISLCLTHGGIPVNNGKTVTATLTCCSAGILCAYLQATASYGSHQASTLEFDLTRYVSSTNPCAWTIAVQSMLASVCDEAPFSPYHVITDYNDWAIIELLECDRESMTARIAWLRMCDTSPSVRECIAAIVCAPRRLGSCYVDLVDCIEYRRSAAREHIRSLHMENPAAVSAYIPDLVQRSFADIVGRSWHVGSRRAGALDYNLAKYIDSNTQHLGVIDALFDNIPLRQLARFPAALTTQSTRAAADHLVGQTEDSCSSWCCSSIATHRKSHSHGELQHLSSNNAIGRNFSHAHSRSDSACRNNRYKYSPTVTMGHSTTLLSARLVQLKHVLLYEKRYATMAHLAHEAEIYTALSSLQGTVLPVFYGAVATDPFSQYDEERQFGLLFEYVADTMVLDSWMKSTPRPTISRIASVKMAVKAGLERIHEHRIGHINVANHVLVSRRDCSIVFVGLTTCKFNVSEHDWLYDWQEFEMVFSSCERLNKVSCAPIASNEGGQGACDSFRTEKGEFAPKRRTLGTRSLCSISRQLTNPVVNNLSGTRSYDNGVQAGLGYKQPQQQYVPRHFKCATHIDFADHRRWSSTIDRIDPSKRLTLNYNVNGSGNRNSHCRVNTGTSNKRANLGRPRGAHSLVT